MSRGQQSTVRSAACRRAILAVVLVAAMGGATIAVPAVAGGTTTAQSAAATTDESYETASQAGSQLEPADEVYLRDDGSAVLRYDETTDVDRLEVGMDVSEGLVHALVVDDTKPGSGLEKANFSAVLDRRGLVGNGSLVAQRPDEITDLQVDVSGEVTDETNRFDATASGTFEGGSGASGLPASAATSGHVTATADRLETSGNATVDTGGAPGAGVEGQSFEASLRDASDGYVLDVTRQRTVPEWAASRWETRETARQTLENQYGSLATELGGKSEIRISQYSFEERSPGKYRLDLEFTVEYTGIDDGIERRLTDRLAGADEADLNRSEANEIAASATELEIETLEVSMRDGGGTVSVEWDVALANYDELTLAAIELAERSSAGEASADGIERARTAVEAQRAADLEWTLEWNASVEQTSSGRTRLDASVTSDTENWGAYVDELEANDIEIRNGVSVDLTAETDGGKLVVDGRFTLAAEELADQVVQSWGRSARRTPTGSSSEASQFVSAVAESELEVARVDANVADGTVRVEGGAKFENMSAVTDALSDGVAISGVASETTDGTTSTYVYVDDMGGVDTESATKSDLEHLDVVGAETTVHRAGEWDEQFPAVETDEMNDYLQSQGDGAGSDTVPGFGFGSGLASVASLLTALVLRRRADG